MKSKESILIDIANESKVSISKLSCTEGWSPSSQNRWIEVTIDGTSEEINDVANAIFSVIPTRCRPSIGRTGENTRKVYINEPY